MQNVASHITSCSCCCSYQTVDLGTAELMQPTYMQMAATLEPLVDLFLCETLSSTAETMAAASAASMSGKHSASDSDTLQRPLSSACAALLACAGKPFWVSWTLEDSEHARLRSGESLQVSLNQPATYNTFLLCLCSSPSVASTGLLTCHTQISTQQAVAIMLCCMLCCMALYRTGVTCIERLHSYCLFNLLSGALSSGTCSSCLYTG